MEENQSPKSTEQRRKLLKGALAASSVAGLGYSGGALAAASVSHCLVKNTNTLSPQVLVSRPSPENPLMWKRVNVTVSGYKKTGSGGTQFFQGFGLDNSGGLYDASTGLPLPSGVVPHNQPSPYQKDVYVLAYFTSSGLGGYAGEYPQIPEPVVVEENGLKVAVTAQASVTCASSLVGTTYTSNILPG